MKKHTVRSSRVLCSAFALAVISASGALGCDEPAQPPTGDSTSLARHVPALRVDAGSAGWRAEGPPAESGAGSDSPAAAPVPPPPPPLSLLGVACARGADCASGFCVDGVCCNISCTGTCLACDLDGLAGVCTPVMGAADPDTCGAPQVCGPGRRCGKAQHEPCARDEDCAGGLCRTYFLDEDGDGFGAAPLARCDDELTPPPGYVPTGGDCCDADARVHPGEVEFFAMASACGSFDYDCDGERETSAPSCRLPCGQLCKGAGAGGSISAFANISLQSCR